MLLSHWMKVKSPSIYNSIKDDIFATLTSNSKKTSEDIINAELYEVVPTVLKHKL